MKKSELRQLFRECINSSGIRETADPREVNVFGYQTKHFDVCPGAQGLYLRIVEENLVDDKDLAIQSAKLHDTLFYMEKVALKGGVKVGPRRYQLRVIDPFDPAVAAGARTGLPAYTREQYLAIAQKIAAEIMRLAREMGLEQEHNYVANHVRIIKNALAKLSPGRLPGSEEYSSVNLTSASVAFSALTWNCSVVHLIAPREVSSSTFTFASQYAITFIFNILTISCQQLKHAY